MSVLIAHVRSPGHTNMLFSGSAATLKLLPTANRVTTRAAHHRHIHRQSLPSTDSPATAGSAVFSMVKRRSEMSATLIVWRRSTLQ